MVTIAEKGLYYSRYSKRHGLYVCFDCPGHQGPQQRCIWPRGYCVYIGLALAIMLATKYIEILSAKNIISKKNIIDIINVCDLSVFKGLVWF